MHLFFMFDEYSDKSSPDEVSAQARIQMDAICHPDAPRPANEWIGGEFTRQCVDLYLCSAKTQSRLEPSLVLILSDFG